MKIATFLAAISIALFFVVGMVANFYGPKVASRFLERGERHTEVELKQFAITSPAEARGYAFPVLFPFDDPQLHAVPCHGIRNLWP
jgi:hypothetical protein